MRAGTWWRATLPSAAVPVLAVALLTSCAQPGPLPGTDPTVTTSEVAADGDLHPGVFRTGLPNGATAKITVPAVLPAGHELERLRREAGVTRATYASVEIDNTRGSSPVTVSRLVLTARDGGTYRLENVARAVRAWRPRTSDGEDRAPDGTLLSAQTAENLRLRIQRAEHDAEGDVAAGARGRALLMGDLAAVPDHFTSLELVPVIGDREVAPVRVRAGHASGDPTDDRADGQTTWGNDLSPDPGGRGTGGDDPGDPDTAGRKPSSGPSPGEPVVPAPVEPDPVLPGPVVPGPVLPDPVVPGPVVPDPGGPGPVVPDPVVPTPGPEDPVVPGAGASQPSTPDPGAPVPGTPASPVVPSGPEPRSAPARAVPDADVVLRTPTIPRPPGSPDVVSGPELSDLELTSPSDAGRTSGDDPRSARWASCSPVADPESSTVPAA